MREPAIGTALLGMGARSTGENKVLRGGIGGLGSSCSATTAPRDVRLIAIVFQQTSIKFIFHKRHRGLVFVSGLETRYSDRD
ncbi:hypothetical protein MATL_G00154770 [Megalops atlanticus]|uniref:Uncharacterized protein n=1 Tax=Megalops atlanticus TaxID=7932 RepID=A0A9D3T5I3_MEGAT|nr:hypothetical protein MATL_G00154770 [Megalops atlanticus]